ncbi:MAG: hypothetical protein QGH50_21245, partial [SAR324 cluster bacterium]|nr:hypothetical protein [SAR324 cluster bacterium]
MDLYPLRSQVPINVVGLGHLCGFSECYFHHCIGYYCNAMFPGQRGHGSQGFLFMFDGMDQYMSLIQSKPIFTRWLMDYLNQRLMNLLVRLSDVICTAVNCLSNFRA